jgi:hypothetical protein
MEKFKAECGPGKVDEISRVITPKQKQELPGAPVSGHNNT